MHYASSVEFYLRDECAGRPWITRLPCPVHVVDRVETYDYVSRGRFVTRYAYHHGYFDGNEREFRDFGMVEQFNTEQLSALIETAAFPGSPVTPLRGAAVSFTSYVVSCHAPKTTLSKLWFEWSVAITRSTGS